MGRTTDDAGGIFVDWGNPGFFTGKTQLLVAYWTKVTAWGGPTWGPGPLKTNFSDKGWWVFSDHAADKIFLTTYGAGGSATGDGVPAPINGQGWISVGYWFGSNLESYNVRSYKNGTLAENASGQDTPIDTAADAFSVALEGPGSRIAEIGVWAESDGSLTATVAASIMAKLANPAHAQRRAVDISDKVVKFYAPLDFNNNDIVGGAAFNGSAHWVDASDHPWAVGGNGGAARHYYNQLMRA